MNSKPVWMRQGVKRLREPRKHTDYTQWWTWAAPFGRDSMWCGYPEGGGDCDSFLLSQMATDHIENLVGRLTVCRSNPYNVLWIKKVSKYTNLVQWLAVFTLELERRGEWEIIRKYDLDTFNAYCQRVRGGAVDSTAQ